MPESLDLWKWIDYMRPYHLTINDITNLSSGDTIQLLCLDRNVCDLVATSDNESVTTIPVVDFFKHGYQLTYRHRRDLEGTACWNCDSDSDSSSYDSQYSDPGCKNNDKTNTNKNPIGRHFSFDIEYKKNCWYPLENGKLPIKDPQEFAKFNHNTISYWKDYPETTRIGWRGPMINFKHLTNAPELLSFPKD